MKELGLPEKLLPRDVRTRWNSTYDMADECLRYREAIDRMCADQKYKLRRYELLPAEWEIVRQLREVLKVRSRTL